MDIKNHENRNVLILSRTFKAGDAITTLNLFSEWPKENLFCASPVKSDFAGAFNEFYLLGDKEITYSFPFKYIDKPVKSEIITGENVRHSACSSIGGGSRSAVRKLYEKLGRPTLQFLDMYETRLSFHISPEFRKWIEKIKPDVLYTSVGDIAMARFIPEIMVQFPDLKLIVHGFDDWLSPTYRIINNASHRKKAEGLFRKVLELSSNRFTATEKMAGEYHERYGLDFRCFTNPAEIREGEGEITKSAVPNVVFTGKVGWHNDSALRLMIKVVDHLSESGSGWRFDIYTDTDRNQIVNLLGKLPDSTVIHPPVPNSEIPALLKSAHVLYLPISTDSQTQKFTRYSMSTKMGEYLASGVPTIYLGPQGIAMTEFLQAHDCAQVLTTDDVQALEKCVVKAVEDPDRQQLESGMELARSYFNKKSVSHNFALEIKKT